MTRGLARSLYITSVNNIHSFLNLVEGKVEVDVIIGKEETSANDKKKAMRKRIMHAVNRI
jgi:hypothetical protein